MERNDDLWRRAHQQADGFLRRHGDPWTRSNRDDLVQESTIAAWRWAQAPHDPQRFWAAVRTITRRVRGRAMYAAARARAVHLESAAGVGCSRDPDDRHFRIAGQCLPEHRVRPFLDAALARLSDLDRRLLLAFHEGFCCAELAVRFRRSDSCVKTRIHRARRRVQRDVEACVRAADSLDGGQPQYEKESRR